MTTLNITNEYVEIRGSDGRLKIDTRLGTPHIISEHNGVFSFDGVSIYYSPSWYAYGTAVGAFHTYVADHQNRTLSIGNVFANASNIFPLIFIKVTASGGGTFGLNAGLHGKWVAMQGSLLTRVWGANEVEIVAPAGLGGGELYTVEIVADQGYLVLSRTFTFGNNQTINGVAAFLGQSVMAVGNQKWPSGVLAQYASTVELKVFICAA